MRFGWTFAAASLSALFCALSQPVSAQTAKPVSLAQYVGSKACAKCHAQTYASWQQTRMANVVRDPAQHPEAVLGDFSKPDPVRTFDLSQVALVYGSRWKQRYFAKAGNDYYVLPAQWDIEKAKWLPYHVEKGTDWWVPFYGESNQDRPTGPLCDGCHSVNYNIATHEVTEWNVGCEKCHGPGSLHAAHPAKNNIVNPGRLDSVRANDVCVQCHSQGQPIGNPIAASEDQKSEDGAQAKYYDWPVGYQPGERLSDFWTLEELRPGTTNFYQYADLTAHKNRMQGNDFVQSNMYHRGLRCFDCHNVHSSQNPSNLIRRGNQLCLNCHTDSNPAGLKGSVSEHTHHAANSAGSQCTACHMPKIAQTIKDNYVSSHTVRFISPRLTEQAGIPNPCTSCHADKSNAWSIGQLRNWNSTSPWRVSGLPGRSGSSPWQISLSLH
jgi:predicted CXXCH cytochrome family protein